MKTFLEKIKTDKIINQISKHAQDVEIYLVGGAIRDYYLGRGNIDKDLIINKADAEIFAQNLAQKLDATFISLDEENKIYRLILNDKINCIDIAAMMGKNIQEDLARRDFTINSIAVNLSDFVVLDPNNGFDDLKAKKIKHINEQNFVDDPLRLLRAFRFQAMLGFEIEHDILEITKKHASKIHSCSIERINYEILKLFSGNYTEKSLLNMDKTGLLSELFPIAEELKKVPPNLHHHLDLFKHSIETAKQVQMLYETSSTQVQEHLLAQDFGGSSRLAHLKLAAFLHDIGKPQTWTIEEETCRHRFIKHDDIGAKMCAKLLKDNKFSKKQINYITKMVKYHIYPSNVIAAPELTEKIYMRLIRKMEDNVIDVIILAMADRLSAKGPEITEEIINQNITGLKTLLEYYLNIKETLKPLPKLLSGEEIMEILNIKPSKELGNVIKALKEAQISGDITTTKEAVKFIEELYISETC